MSFARGNGPSVAQPFPGMATDPWKVVTYAASTRGVAAINATFPKFTLTGTNPVLGRFTAAPDASTWQPQIAAAVRRALIW